MKTPSYYHFNEKFAPEQVYYVVPNRTTFLSVFTRGMRKNNRVNYTDGAGLFIICSLKPRKSNWISSNIICSTYEKK